MLKKFAKQRPIAEINITPFTDVILVLLVIFMIATPIILQRNIEVNLPVAKSSSTLHDTGPKYITISGEGLVYLGKDLVTEKELKEKMKILHEKDPDVGVIVMADQSVRFKDVVGVLDILNELGVRRLNIATKAN